MIKSIQNKEFQFEDKTISYSFEQFQDATETRVGRVTNIQVVNADGSIVPSDDENYSVYKVEVSNNLLNYL